MSVCRNSKVFSDDCFKRETAGHWSLNLSYCVVMNVIHHLRKGDRAKLVTKNLVEENIPVKL